MTDAIAQALITARQHEAATGKPHYVVKCHDGTVIVTDSAPYMGEWYSSDGVQHGAG